MRTGQVGPIAVLSLGVLLGTAVPRPAAAAVVVGVRTPHLRVAVVEPAPRVRRGLGEHHVNVDPERARVFIDGKYAGRGDQTRALRAGRHAVRVVLANGREASEVFDVAPGRMTRVRLDLD